MRGSDTRALENELDNAQGERAYYASGRNGRPANNKKKAPIPREKRTLRQADPTEIPCSGQGLAAARPAMKRDGSSRRNVPAACKAALQQYQARRLLGTEQLSDIADVESSFDEPRGWQSRGATGDWAERKKSEDENWQRTTKYLRSELEDNAPLIELLKLEEGLVIQKLIQQRADDSWKLHPCCLQDDGSFSNSMLDPLEPGNVEVVFLGIARGTVIVPRWNCRQCQSTVTVNPVHTNCFPATPCSPSMWFHRLVMDFYKQLALHNGVSQTVLEQAVRRAGTRNFRLQQVGLREKHEWHHS
eukprot:gene21083-27966_t